MVKILYIAGWGRSGTTIVDNILNSYKGVFSTGELFYLWHRGLLIGRRCGCGVKFAECATWQNILSLAFGSRLPDPAHVVELQKQAIRVRHTQQLADGALSAEAEEYREIYTKLCHAIADVTGAALIVDSSKVPSGAALLTRMPGTVPYLLHMVRDPRAVTHSWMRSASAVGPTTSAMHWLVRNAITERLTRAFPDRHTRLRYEDFARCPQDTLEEVLTMTGVEPADGPFVDENTVLLKPNHTIAGNPSRFRNGEIAVRPDHRWRTEQRRGARLTATALAWPMLHKYGYRARV
ncbi:sulfotransferase [Paractinoplanes toevensis]|uniref:Sulfotransferase family protein n=1 Tax=Paractinoplanes toevensis TaxID=571911 RepID=A0A919W9X2_9ACTN|nr:sulfotransferase [Actinoplanes toevensis]GIM96319.1 sulfotransferase family protein [Actinoplanes toevensis]